MLSATLKVEIRQSLDTPRKLRVQAQQQLSKKKKCVMGGGRRCSIEEKTEIPMYWKQIDGTKPEDVRKLGSIILLPSRALPYFLQLCPLPSCHHLPTVTVPLYSNLPGKWVALEEPYQTVL